MKITKLPKTQATLDRYIKSLEENEIRTSMNYGKIGLLADRGY